MYTYDWLHVVVRHGYPHLICIHISPVICIHMRCKLACNESLNLELVDRIEKLIDNLRSRS